MKNTTLPGWGFFAVLGLALSLVTTSADEKGDETPEKSAPAKKTMKKEKDAKAESPEKLETATLGGGCFWCIEAVFEEIDGVADAVSGYMGGHVDNPTYEQICTKTTGHAEVVQLTYDPEKISFAEVLEIFWQIHDPTTMNRQGYDVGPQYRSAIFYHSPEQKNAAEESIKKLNESGLYEDPAVTEVTEAATFWVAEVEHQDYYRINKSANPYCRAVILPKMKKMGLE